MLQDFKVNSPPQFINLSPMAHAVMDKRFSVKDKPNDSEIYKMFNALETESPVGRKKKVDQPTKRNSLHNEMV